MKKLFSLLILLFVAWQMSSCDNTASSVDFEKWTQIESYSSLDIQINPFAESYLFDSLKAKEVKIVLRNDSTENLVYVNWTRDTVYSVEFVSDASVYHPTISPDGKYVAFSTEPEPLKRKSYVFYQPLNLEAKTREMIDGAANVPRFRVLPSGDTVLMYVSSAGVNDKTSFWEDQSTYIVNFPKFCA